MQNQAHRKYIDKVKEYDKTYDHCILKKCMINECRKWYNNKTDNCNKAKFYYINKRCLIEEEDDRIKKNILRIKIIKWELQGRDSIYNGHSYDDCHK